MQHPLVYIIILTWNGKEDTLECLRSLQNISYPNAKILVVDNASHDNVVDAIRHEFPHVELIVNTTNMRFAGGNNVGIQHAVRNSAEYILLLNNDTIAEKDFLSHLVTCAQSDPVIGMAGPKIYYYKDRTRLWYAGGNIEWWKGWISHRGIREDDRGQYDTPVATQYITGCCLLVRRNVIEKIGILDESYFIYGEDADWCIRTSRSGYKLMFEPAAKIWHKVSVSSGGNLSWFKNWNKLKSQLRLMGRYAKPYHWITIPAMIPLSILFSYLKLRQKS